MSARDDNDADPGDRRSREEDSTAEDEPMVIFEFSIPAEAFLLEVALREFPDVVVEYERLVPTNHSPLPYLWTTGGSSPAFEDAMEDDPMVESVATAATFDQGALYRIDWTEADGELLHWVSTTHEEIALLQAQGHDGEWILKLRFPSRAMLSGFHAFYEAEGIDVDVLRLYDLTEPKIGQYDITEKQREALVAALEMGHFDVPRSATLTEVADALGISPKATSERLRRGQTNLISNALTIGRPTGVGIGGQ